MNARRARPTLLLALLLTASCGVVETTVAPRPDPEAEAPAEETEPTTGTPAAGLLRGVGLSPAGFPDDFSALEAFFDEVAGWGRGAAMWNGAWRDDATAGTDAGEIPVAAALVAGRAEGGARFAPIAVFGWRSGDTPLIRVPADDTNDWRNTAAAAAFRDAVAAYAEAYRPALVFLGNESDFYWALDPDDYQRWIAVYDDAYDAIKAASPDTLVGPVFNVEHLMGWGTYSGWTSPQTEAFTLHDRTRIDVVGLTVYPYLGHAAPADVAVDYLAPVFDLVGDLPVAITETGWPAEAPAGPVAWQPGEAEQVAYLTRLGEMLAGRDVRLVNWLFLHPMASGSPEVLATFGTVSLRDAAGAPRPIYEAFVAFE